MPPHKYVFLSWRYVFTPLEGEAAVESGNVTEFQRVDTLVHDDGRQYDISSMDDGEIRELFALAESGADAVAFSEALGKYKKAAE
jgi:hypothetical protein